jgi:hypothetical protein
MNIRILLLAGFTAFLLLSCSSNRTITSSEEKSFYSKLRKLEKDPGNITLRQEVIDLYEVAINQQQDRVSALLLSSDLSRFDKLIKELEQSQKISDAIRSSPAYRYITPPNYYQQIAQLREDATREWYNEGEKYLRTDGRENAKYAYRAFKKAGQYGSGNTRFREKMNEAYEKGTINIVIRPVQFEHYYFGSWNYNLQWDQQTNTLVNDLGGRYAGSVPARFYTEQEAMYRRIDPNWIVDLVWTNLDFSEPTINRQTRTLTKSIQVGVDTAGRPQYKTVTANLHVQRRIIQGSGYLEYRITDMINRKNESGNRSYAHFNWEDEFATYDGDSRALEPEDWQLINSKGRRVPERTEILDEMYRNVYTEIKNKIKNEADW